MYSQDAIEALTGRVGWKLYPTSFPFALSDENKKSDSGRYFQDFSALATLNNVKESMEDAAADESSFNAYLTDMQRAAIATVLSAIFSDDKLLDEDRVSQIFEDAVETNKNLFDEVIGLQMACSIVEMMQHTIRTNQTERIGRESSASLFEELNGMYTRNGAPVSTGLKNRISREVSKLKYILFPKMKPFISTPCFT